MTKTIASTLLLANLLLHGALAPAAEEPAAAPPPLDTQRNAPRLTTPAEAAAAFRVPPGFRATLWAAEPDVRQPIAAATDPRGQLWVAENYTYAELPGSFDARQRDRIVVLADRDGDGRADHRRVFWDQAQQLTSVEVGLGGVWALCPPQLLFLPDRDGDDRPDGPPQVLLDGFDVGPANRHNFANGLRWGPDGWLYGRNGISHVGRVGAPGTPVEERTVVGPGMWRYHPLQRRFEVVATGTTNPWGHDWDQHGELFFINTVIGHLWHVVPGAHFKRMFGADANPYVYELLDQTADHVHWDTREVWQDVRKGVSGTTAEAGGGHAHSGLLIYQGDQWPAEFRHGAYAINLHGRRLNCDRPTRHGASYTATHGPDGFFTSDEWFRGIDLLPAPDGGVLLLDWSDVGECHEADGVHRSSGRVFHFGYGERAAPVRDWSQADSRELIGSLVDKNIWVARQAQNVLRDRAAAGADVAEWHRQLRDRFDADRDALRRLHWLWALYVTGGTSEDWLAARLTDDDEHVRSWLVRLLCDLGPPSLEVESQLDDLARNDASGLVLLYLASSLQKLPVERRGALGRTLAEREPWAHDRVYPLMLWYGLEPWVSAEPAQAAELAAAAEIPLVRRFVARRITQLHAARPETVDRLVQVAAAGNRELRRDVLHGIWDALRGVRRAAAPAAWPKLQRALNRDADDAARVLAQNIAAVFGDGLAVEALRKLAEDNEADPDARRSAIQSLAQARPAGAAEWLQGLLGDFDVAEAAIRGLAEFDDAATPALLAQGLGRMHPTARDAALETLVSRTRFAAALVEQVAAGRFGRELVSVSQVRQMHSLGDEKLTAALLQVWPELQPVAGERRQAVERLKRQLAEGGLAQARAAAGRRVWEKSCAKCHTLFGAGGKIGPDLTGSQRSNLDFLVENVVDPSATLAEGFRLTTLALRDGRVVQGVVLTRTDETWEVQTASERLVVAADDIDEHQATRLSLMPDGLLDVLSAAEVRDLFGYLMSPDQVEGEE